MNKLFTPLSLPSVQLTKVEWGKRIRGKQRWDIMGKLQNFFWAGGKMAGS
jgi:hypothetical protein